LEDPNPVCPPRHQLDYVPLPGLTLSTLAIVHRDKPLSAIGKEYLQLLSEQISALKDQ